MQTPPPGDNAHGPAGTSPVEVWRCPSGSSAFVRMLSHRYAGLFTHYFKDRSVYCPGEGCPAERHKIPREFKAYIASERWIQQKGFWLPCVLEATCRLEQDLQELYERGQVWEIARRPDEKRRRFPAVGRLHEQLDSLTLPPAFDVTPVLCGVFRVAEIALNEKNPMPPRLVLPPSDGRPPMKIEKKGDTPAPPEEQAAFRRKLREQGFLRETKE